MEQEILYTTNKWSILKELENGAKTPTELSQLTGVSLPTISQQLRLLEIAGLVGSKKIKENGNSKRLYYLLGNQCYIISTADNFVEKKRVSFDKIEKIMLKLWFLDDEEIKRFAEKAIWELEENLSNIDSLYINTSQKNPITFYVTYNKKIDNMNKLFEVKRGLESRPVAFVSITKEELSSFFELKDNLIKIY